MDKDITNEQLKRTVKISKAGTYVQSNDIAKIFDKHHKVVLKMISNKIKELEEMNEELIGTKLCRLISKYFKDSTYIDSKGRTYKRYSLTRKGFDLIVLSMTGKKALKYKIWYIDCFHEKDMIIQKDKELARNHLSNDMFLELRRNGKDIRKLFTSVIQECELPQRIAENKDASRFVGLRITNYTKLVYKIIDLEIPKGADPRDVCTPAQVAQIMMLEDKISDMIRLNTENNIHYKDSYQKIKEKLSK